MCNFKTRLKVRDYLKNLIESTLSEVSFAERQSALKNKPNRLKAKLCFLWRHTIHW